MTAVEFIHNIAKRRKPDQFDWKQAKEMERKQILLFAEEYDEYVFRGGSATAEQYYEETFKNKINLVEIPREQLEKERNPNYKYFSIDETTSQLPGINVNDVKPSNPQMVKENFSTKNK